MKSFDENFVYDNLEEILSIFSKYNIKEVYMNYKEIIVVISVKFKNKDFEPIYKIEEDLVDLCNKQNCVALFTINNLVLYGQEMQASRGSILLKTWT